MDGHGYNAGGFGAGPGGFGGTYAEPEPSQQIMVRNVCGMQSETFHNLSRSLVAVVNCQRGFG
jgi:hypothetical protein